jgi:hypothetical protein
MGLTTNVAGIFSRYFIVGFFLPAFFALAILDGLVPESHQPCGYERLNGSNELVVLAGVALLLGLLLSALNTTLLWVLDGWPLHEARDKRVRGTLFWRLGRRSFREHTRCSEVLLDEQASDEAKTRAAYRLAERYSANEDEILPTRLGNARRSVETHPRGRYSLDGPIVLPRMRMLLTDGERQQIVDAEGDVAFMVNGIALVGLVAVPLVIVVASSGYALLPTILLVAAVAAGSSFASWVLYELALRVSIDRWGPLVRASFDLHRLELYERLGMKRPANPSDDRAVGDAIGASLVYGYPFRAEVRDEQRAT